MSDSTAAAPTTAGPDAARLAGYVEAWRSACADFLTLAREVPEDQWDAPTDLDGWTVKDNVAHTAHLEAVLTGTPEETREVEPAPHIRNATGWYTEQGVLARRDRDMASLVDELETAVAARSAQLAAAPPTDGQAVPPKTPGDVAWNNETLLGNRPVDVWMHEQDIRRAIGRPGGMDSLAAVHTMTRLAAGLPLVVGKRVAPPVGTTVVLAVPAAGISAAVVVGEDGRARPTSGVVAPTVQITLDPETFIVLAGGRRTPDRVTAQIEGDDALGRQVLASLAVTP